MCTFASFSIINLISFHLLTIRHQVILGIKVFSNSFGCNVRVNADFSIQQLLWKCHTLPDRRQLEENNSLRLLYNLIYVDGRMMLSCTARQSSLYQGVKSRSMSQHSTHVYPRLRTLAISADSLPEHNLHITYFREKISAFPIYILIRCHSLKVLVRSCAPLSLISPKAVRFKLT